jgi:hypothetical protein
VLREVVALLKYGRKRVSKLVGGMRQSKGKIGGPKKKRRVYLESPKSTRHGGGCAELRRGSSSAYGFSGLRKRGELERRERAIYRCKQGKN